MNMFCQIMQKCMGANEYIKMEDVSDLPSNSKQLSVNYFTGENDWPKIYRDQLHCIQNSTINFFMYMYIVDCFATLRVMSAHESCPHLQARQKFIGLHKTMDHLQNNFYTKENWDQALDLFGKAQRTYYALNRLAYHYKRKRATFKIKEDLSLHIIDPSHSHCITVYQDNALYLFTLADLINVIKSALMNCSNFFVKPLYPKNPYTNRPFSMGTLLDIYLAIKSSTFTMPTLFQLFFLAEFDIQKYTFENEAIIRDVYIKNYVKTTNYAYLYVDVKDMLKRTDLRKRIRIHSDFPKDILVDIMRPYLELYFTYNFSISNTEKKFRSYYDLKAKLNEFIKYNPLFGRKIMILQPMKNSVLPFTQNSPLKKRPFYIGGFNMKHIPFYHSTYHNERVPSDDEEDEAEDDAGSEDEEEEDDAGSEDEEEEDDAGSEDEEADQDDSSRDTEILEEDDEIVISSDPDQDLEEGEDVEN